MPSDVNCLETLLLWRDNYTSINRELYGGYRSGNRNNIINEISAGESSQKFSSITFFFVFINVLSMNQTAFDFGNTSPTKLDVTIWYNDTLRNPAANKPPGMLRLPRSMNLVVYDVLCIITMLHRGCRFIICY